MKIKQLQKVVEVADNQRVKINDTRNQRTIESSEGWVFDLDYDYPGHNYEEVERILNLKVDSVSFEQDWLYIWAS